MSKTALDYEEVMVSNTQPAAYGLKSALGGEWDGQSFVRVADAEGFHADALLPLYPESTVKALQAENERLRAAVEYADACFEAALAEGWVQALHNRDTDRIRDLWIRRLSMTRDKFPEALTKGQEPGPSEGSEWVQYVYWIDKDGVKHNGFHPSLQSITKGRES